MMYSDYFKNALSEAKIKFEIIEDIVPPILNEQRWFVIEPVLGYDKETEQKVDDFMWAILKKKYSLPFLFVKEKYYNIFKRIYFLDFNLPVEKVRERFSTKIPGGTVDEIPLKPFSVKSFPSSQQSDFFSYDFLLYDEVPIISKKFHFTNILFIIRSALEGHKILFELKSYIQCSLKKEKSSIYFNIKPYYKYYYDKNRGIEYFCNEFYYYDGIIKFHSPYEKYIIDNNFLIELKELIEILSLVIIEIFRRKDLSDFYKKLTDELSKRVSVSYTMNKVEIYFSEKEISRKLSLFQDITIPCIKIIKYFLGEALEPVKDEEKIEEQKEYLVKNLKIIEEILSTVI